MFTQFTSFAIATAIAGTAMSSSPIDTADVNELRDMVRQLRDEVAELKVEQGQSWLSEQRADEVRLLVHDVLSDADTRASLQGSGAQSGYDGGFFIASDNGNFKLKIGGLLQTRSHMAVSIKGNLYACMTQPLLHYLGMYTLLQHQ